MISIYLETGESGDLSVSYKVFRLFPGEFLRLGLYERRDLFA